MLRSSTMRPTPPQTYRTPLRRLRLWGLTLPFLLLLACTPKSADPLIVRAEIETFLGEYLPKLAAAYGDLNASLLEGFAVPKEIASIDKIIDELAEQGRFIRPTLKSFTLEEISQASYTISLVTVLEVWDLRSYALGSETQLQEILDQRKRVKYQIRKDQNRWSVTFRQVVDQNLG